MLQRQTESKSDVTEKKDSTITRKSPRGVNSEPSLIIWDDENTTRVFRGTRPMAPKDQMPPKVRSEDSSYQNADSKVEWMSIDMINNYFNFLKNEPSLGAISAKSASEEKEEQKMKPPSANIDIPLDNHDTTVKDNTRNQVEKTNPDDTNKDNNNKINHNNQENNNNNIIQNNNNNKTDNNVFHNSNNVHKNNKIDSNNLIHNKQNTNNNIFNNNQQNNKTDNIHNHNNNNNSKTNNNIDLGKLFKSDDFMEELRRAVAARQQKLDDDEEAPLLPHHRVASPHVTFSDSIIEYKFEPTGEQEEKENEAVKTEK